MVRPVDTSAFDKVNSIADYDKLALAEARKRAAEDQGLEIQRRQADMLQKKFELDQQKFDEDRARAAQGLFTGDSIQAQIGNQMAGLGYTPQQVIEALTMKGVPLANGGFGTYSPPNVVGPPGGNPSPQPIPQPQPAPAPQTAPNTPPPPAADSGILGKGPLSKEQMEAVLKAMQGQSPFTTIVEPNDPAAKQKAEDYAKDQKLLKNRISAIQEAEGILKSPESQPTQSNTGYFINILQKEAGLGGNKARDANARLALLGGFLTSSVPRMEGPQGVTDVLMYKEMAGKVGDPTATISERVAALDTLKKLSDKYADNSGMAPAAGDITQPQINNNAVDWREYFGGK